MLEIVTLRGDLSVSDCSPFIINSTEGAT